VDVDAITEPTKLFEGSAAGRRARLSRERQRRGGPGARGCGTRPHPASDLGRPTLERNTHTIKVDADSARFEMTIENIPSVEKPGTGRITALSMIVALEGLTSPLKVAVEAGSAAGNVLGIVDVQKVEEILHLGHRRLHIMRINGGQQPSIVLYGKPPVLLDLVDAASRDLEMVFDHHEGAS